MAKRTECICIRGEGLRCRVTLRSWKPHHIILLLVRCPKKKCSGSVHQVAAADFDKTFCNPHLRSQWALSWTNVKMHLSKMFSFLCRSATAQSSWRGLCLSPKSKLQRKSSLFQKIFNLWENIPSFRKYSLFQKIFTFSGKVHSFKKTLLPKLKFRAQICNKFWIYYQSAYLEQTWNVTRITYIFNGQVFVLKQANRGVC